MAELLFEVGTEELPPGLISNLTSQIKENVIKDLKENDILITGEVKVYNTPRRIAIYIKNLPEEQKLKTLEVRGPDKEKAFDKNGLPTQAAIGFAKKYGLEPKDLDIKKVNDHKYVFVTTKTGGKKTQDLLSEILPNSLRHTTGDKFMKWGKYDEKFARPVRWILAILDSKVIKFSYAGVNSDKYTYGHRFLSEKPIEISKPTNYEKELEENYIIACQDKRKELIKNLIEQNSKIIGSPSINNSHLDEVTNITEYPCALVCEFDKEFLELPSVVIETVLVKHQKYFAIYDSGKKDEILNQFIVITNGTETINKTLREVKKGNEKVVKARLNDAKFFFEEDLKRPFTYEERINDLSKITFQKGVGSMKEKTERITKLSTFIYDCLFDKKDEVISPYNQQVYCKRSDVIGVAKLCKLDLTTHMVFEMPELQSTMGKIYAKKNKHPEVICRGIEEHYYKTYGDNTTAHIVGIADRLDNIISLFSIGKIPTGSSDPFALRSQTQWIFIHTDAISDQYDKTLNFEILIKNYSENIAGENLKQKITNEVISKTKGFLTERLELTLLPLYGTDIINSVFCVSDPLGNIKETKHKLRFLSNLFFQPKQDEKDFLTAAKRLVRIVEPNINGALETNLLKSEEEKTLFKLFNEIGSLRFERLDDYYKKLKSLTIPINTFFDKVLVNDPDPKIKQARQALLKKGKDLFEKICDFNKIIERN